LQSWKPAVDVCFACQHCCCSNVHESRLGWMRAVLMCLGRHLSGALLLQPVILFKMCNLVKAPECVICYLCSAKWHYHIMNSITY
jgi:hypothetical protein